MKRFLGLLFFFENEVDAVGSPSSLPDVSGVSGGSGVRRRRKAAQPVPSETSEGTKVSLECWLTTCEFTVCVLGNAGKCTIRFGRCLTMWLRNDDACWTGKPLGEPCADNTLTVF